MTRSVDVVVVGAGLSGLVAARDLARKGVDVVVLEAADRVGGRSMAVTSALGSRLDLGGQWIGADHHRLSALAAELGLSEYPMHTGTAPAILDGERRVRLVSPATIMVLLVLAVVSVLSRLRLAGRWSDISLADALARVPGRRARRLLEVIALTSWTADPEKMSMAGMASMMRSQGGVRHMLGTKGGAQDSLLVEGVGSIVERLADELGSRVLLSTRVESIARDDTGATVRTRRGDFRAVRVILTVPPPVAAQIDHEPPLPDQRSELERYTFMGTVYKAIAVYPEPFWRARITGELIVLGAPAFAVFDSSAPGGPGHLCMLVGGSEAQSLDRLSPAERQDKLLGALAKHFGPAVLRPASWHDKAWHLDEFAGGGYVALPSLGSTAGFVPMPSAPIGRLHWSGSETASDHPGYLDGAIEAGLRSATEVADALAVHP